MAGVPKNVTRPGPGWLTKAEMSAVFDVAPRTWESTYRRYAGPESTKQVGGVGFYHCRRILDAWAAAQGDKPAATDPMLVGGEDSPALERYRLARARLVEMELEQREKTHVAIAEIEPQLMRLGGLIRRAGETLARKYGNDAADVVNQAIDQWQGGVRGTLKSDDRGTDAVESGGGRGESPAPANTA
jgi:phage terminase Nu1 subunit (DNA packaging protein)